MTSPTPSGHPDWQDYVNWRGQVFTSGNQNVSAGSPITVSEYVTNFASIYLKVSVALNNLTVTVQFYTDNTLATLVETYTWQLLGGQKLSTIIPTVGNFAVFTISTTIGVSFSSNVTIAPTSIVVPACRYPSPGNLIAGNGLSIGAGLSFTALLPQVMEGDGIVTVNPRTGGGTTSIKVYDITSVAIQDILAQSNNPGGPVSLEFLSGNLPVQLEIDNNDAAAHAYDFSVRVVGR